MWLCAVIYAVLFGWLTTALFQGRLLTFKKKFFLYIAKAGGGEGLGTWKLCICGLSG